MIELIEKKIILDNNDEIREYYTDKGNVRAYVTEECIQSLMYIDNKKTHELAIDYFKNYDLPVDINKNGTKYLMLGGGMFVYSHHFLNKYIDKNIDIVEINAKCIEYAKKYFYLEDLIKKYNNRINIFIDDATKYIEKSKQKYDYILIDLFNGKKVVNQMFENECIKKVIEILSDNGIIAINYIISDINIYTYKNQLQNIVKNTKNYKIVTNELYFNNDIKLGNIFILLSNCEINIPREYEYIDVSNIIKFVNVSVK